VIRGGKPEPYWMRIDRTGMRIDLSQPAPRVKTLEEAQALIEVLWSLLREQQAQIEDQARRIEALEEKLCTNSRNSSKPPSSVEELPFVELALACNQSSHHVDVKMLVRVGYRIVNRADELPFRRGVASFFLKFCAFERILAWIDLPCR
jgi:hypothetical protein